MEALPGNLAGRGTRGILVTKHEKKGAFGRLVCLAFAALLGLVAISTQPACAQGAGEAVARPGSRLGIVPPEGFVQNDDFAEFENPELGASILFGEMQSIAYAQLRGGFPAEAMAQSHNSGVRITSATLREPPLSILNLESGPRRSIQVLLRSVRC